MAKKTEIELTPDEAKLLAESVDEKVKVLEKLSAACLRENIIKAADPINGQIHKLQELRSDLEEIYQPSLGLKI